MLKATPHAVFPGKTRGSAITRNTFALFMEPDFDEPMDIPEGSDEDIMLDKANF